MSNHSRTRPEAFIRWQPALLNFSRSLFNSGIRYYHAEPSVSLNTLRINLSMILRAWFDANEAGDSDWDIFDLDPRDKHQLSNLHCYYCFNIAQIPSADPSDFRQGVTIFNRVRLNHFSKNRPLPPGIIQFPTLANTPVIETRVTNSLRGGLNKLTDCLQKDLIPFNNLDAINAAAVLISSGYLSSVYLNGIPNNIEELRNDYGLDTLENTPTLYQLL